LEDWKNKVTFFLTGGGEKEERSLAGAGRVHGKGATAFVFSQSAAREREEKEGELRFLASHRKRGEGGKKNGKKRGEGQ